LIKSENILAVTSLDLKAGFFFSLSLKIKLEQNFLKFENFYWANILGISFDDAVTIGRPSASQETHGLYYKHCYDCTLTTLEVVNAVACNINTIMIIIDDLIHIMIVMTPHQLHQIINYAPMVMPQFRATD